VSGPSERPLGGAALVRLVAAREISTRIRDKGFLISSLFIVLLLLGIMAFQFAVNAGGHETRLGVVGDRPGLAQALEVQGQALGRDVRVVPLHGDAAARAAVERDDVDAALLVTGGRPELLVHRSADSTLQALVQGAVGRLAIDEQLARAGVHDPQVPEVAVTSLDPHAERNDQRTFVAVIGVSVLYGLLLLFGQFVAQGVVEEKASRVVELLLATMRPGQLLAGKILGLGLLGLGQIAAIGVVSVAGSLAFDLIAVPADLIGTTLWVVAWFVLGYAFYASIFAVAASLVSRQEDLASVLTPTSVLLIVGFVVALQAARDPAGTLATVTSYVPGLSPTVMPVRQAAGVAAGWEVALSVVLMLAAVVLVVRLGGRVYSGALLRTGGRLKIREALRADRG
jgi:ABC-2 type transport system permease protein